MTAQVDQLADKERLIDFKRLSRGRRLARLTLPPLVFGVCFLAVWYAIAYLVLDEKRRFLLRPLHEVLQVGFFDWDNFSKILKGLWWTGRVSLIGLLISIVIGCLLAMAMSQSKLVERAVFPYMVTLQAIPILAMVPLIGFWWGYGQFSRVIVCVVISLFPIIVNTLLGLQSAEPGMHDMFTLHNAGRLTRLRKLMFPAALPAMFAGFRISAGLSVVGAIVGDFFFGQGPAGLGQLLRRYVNNVQGEELLATIIVSSILGIVVFWSFGLLRKIVIGKWYEAA